MNYFIRELRKDERGILEEMLYETIFQPEGSKPISREIVKQPDVSLYIDNFGRDGDYCLVAQVDDKIVGAVWVRVWKDSPKGYGYVDGSTPEFSISLLKGYRGMGMGFALMKRMISLLRKNGYKQASLSVSKDNYAVKLYKKLGFKIIKERRDDYVMLLDLKLK